jgi:hypothetical protein
MSAACSSGHQDAGDAGVDGHDRVTSKKRAQAKQAGPTARARGQPPIGSNSQAALIVLWLRYALRSRTFGTPPARVHSGENVLSLNLRQSAIVISLRLSPSKLERSCEAERMLLSFEAMKSLNDRESSRDASSERNDQEFDV